MTKPPSYLYFSIKRPSFQQMIDDIENGKIQCAIVHHYIKYNFYHLKGIDKTSIFYLCPMSASNHLFYIILNYALMFFGNHIKFLSDSYHQNIESTLFYPHIFLSLMLFEIFRSLDSDIFP